MKLKRLGRSSFNEISVQDPTVSRRHAEIVLLSDSRLFVTDCMSTGGTFVEINGRWEPIRQDYVNAGQQLKFGGVVMSTDELTRR